MLGCLLTHAIGRKGGDALIRRRFTGPRIDRATSFLKRYGVMSVLIASLLPPPAPFKIFILLAGVIGISATRLATAILIGRGIRYTALGYLAFRYGDRAAGLPRRTRRRGFAGTRRGARRRPRRVSRVAQSTGVQEPIKCP